MKSAKILFDIISIEELEEMEKEALKEIMESYFDKTDTHTDKLPD